MESCVIDLKLLHIEILLLSSHVKDSIVSRISVKALWYPTISAIFELSKQSHLLLDISFSELILILLLC